MPEHLTIYGLSGVGDASIIRGTVLRSPLPPAPAARLARPAFSPLRRPAPALPAAGDPALALEAGRRLGHHLGGYDLARPAPQEAAPPVPAPATPIQRNGDGEDDEPMELGEDEFDELKERGGKALTKVVTGHQPAPGGKIDNLLDVLHMMHGYHGMHEEHLDPVAFEEPTKVEKKEGGESEEEEEEEEEPRGEVVSKTVRPVTPSPYTHNTNLLFGNLAQSYIHGVGTYEPNQKGDGSSVSEYLGKLPKEIGKKDVLSLVSAPSFKSFSDQFAEKRPIKPLKEAPPEEEEEKNEETKRELTQTREEENRGIEKENTRSDEARTNLWSISQLLDLESARRRSGGVMNAVGILQDLGEKSPNVKDRLVSSNVLSHEGASGKSVDLSPGKLKRLDKSNDVMTALLSGESNPQLDKLRERMHSFVQTAPTLEGYKEAKQTWSAAAGIKEGKMKLGISKQLKEGKKDEKIQSLKDDPSFQELQGSFAELMRGYYGTGEKPNETKDLDTKKSVKALQGTDKRFLTWLINKAASGGHQTVLSEASQKHGLLPKEGEEEPKRRHEASEFLTMFGANKDPQTATKVQHVANLRRAYEMSKESEVFGKSRIHANNRGRHFRPGFGRYENLPEEVVEPIEQLHTSEIHGLGKEEGLKQSHQLIRSFIGASNKGQFTSTTKQVQDTVDDYEKKYNEKEEEIYKEYGVGKGQRLSETKRTKLMSKLGVKEMLGGVDDFRPRVKQHAKFSAIHPKKVRKSTKALGGLRDVYRTLETDRDYEGGAMNEIFRAEGFESKDKPLDPNALLNTYNIMSPQGVNTSQEIKSNQFKLAREKVKLKGPITQGLKSLNAKRKRTSGEESEKPNLEEEARRFDDTLESFYRKRLKGNEEENK